MTARHPLLDVQAEDPIERKIDTLQTFLGEHYFHDSGIMYSMWYWKDDELRPYSASDIRPDQKYLQTSAGFSPQGHNNSENSPWTSGWFLLSQCFRYRATGDAQALKYAVKAFRSIDIIYRLSEERGRAGFICKPYDWIVSEETSVDQYTAVMLALWEFFPLADGKTQERIRQMLREMADWWRNANYVLIYFERRYDLLPYHAARMACLNAMVFRVTTIDLYAKECERLLAMCDAWPTVFDLQLKRIMDAEQRGEAVRSEHDFESYDPDKGRYLFRCRQYPGEMYLGLACAEWFFRNEAYRAPLLKHVIARFWRQMQYGLRPDDLLALYGMEVDLKNGTWRAVRTQPTTALRENVLAGSIIDSYFSEICWGDSTSRIVDASIMAHLHAPEFCPGALNLASKMLRNLDNPRLHAIIDPDGEQLLPELVWQRDMLSSDVPAFTLLSYWRAKAFMESVEL